MWEILFFKYTSVVLAVLGSVIGMFIYLIHDSVFPNNPVLSHIIAGLLFSLVPGTAGFICGRLIHSLHYSAHRDQLTNLWNSRYFYSQITKQIATMKKTESSFCMAMIDLDDFKVINDTYGHVVGDEVLRGIGTILTRNIRDSDIVIRLGGDEFVIIFPDTIIEKASAMAERLRGIIESSRECRDVTISIGVLLVECDVEVDELLKMVDDTLYKAKKTKNLVVLNTCS